MRWQSKTAFKIPMASESCWRIRLFFTHSIERKNSPKHFGMGPLNVSNIRTIIRVDPIDIVSAKLKFISQSLHINKCILCNSDNRLLVFLTSALGAWRLYFVIDAKINSSLDVGTGYSKMICHEHYVALFYTFGSMKVCQK